MLWKLFWFLKGRENGCSIIGCAKLSNYKLLAQLKTLNTTIKYELPLQVYTLKAANWSV